MSRRIVFLVTLLLALFAVTAAQAQEDFAYAEASTDEFLAEHFHFQDRYTAVRCVSGDGSCPAEVSAFAPCLLANCPRDSHTYPIEATYETIQEAADAAQPGDLIVITPGRYAGLIVEEKGGADGAYIHFLGLGNIGDVIVDRLADPSVSWLRHHFYFIAAHHYIIENIAFENAERGAGIFVSGYFSGTGQFSHHFVVSNVYAHDNGEWGMHTTSTNYIVVQDSAFTNSVEEHGVYISGSGDHVLLRRNILQGNNAAGIQVNADPQTAMSEVYYWLQESTGETCGISEDDVWSSATWQEIKDCYDEQGLPDLGEYFEDGISSDIRIENNIITGNGAAGGAGINLASVRNSVVRGNVIYGNDAAGIACWDNAYAEEKGLDSSEFGCHVVEILENTLVDETGGRGSLIITHDASDNYVINNIIVRDRFDAYEVGINSGVGLNSYGNYYSAMAIDDSSAGDFFGDQFGITDFTVAEALAQFVNPTVEPWILEEGDGYVLNPERPDFRPVAGSVLATGRVMPSAAEFDMFGLTRGDEIGALAVGE